MKDAERVGALTSGTARGTAPGACSFRIGRASDNDIVLADDTVSRHHAELRFLDDGRLLLCDSKSSQGTVLTQFDESREVDEAFVTPTDQVRFGDMTVTVGDMIEELRLKHPELRTAYEERAPTLRRCECGAVKREGEACPECG